MAAIRAIPSFPGCPFSLFRLRSAKWLVKYSAYFLLAVQIALPQPLDAVHILVIVTVSVVESKDKIGLD